MTDETKYDPSWSLGSNRSTAFHSPIPGRKSARRHRLVEVEARS